MNRIFKTIWNAARQCLVAANETLADDWLASLKANALYEGRSSAFSFEYGMTEGNIRKLSHSIMAKAEVRF